MTFCVNFRFVEDGVNFSINSDDPLICQANLWSEFHLAFNKLGLNTAVLTKAVSLVSVTCISTCCSCTFSVCGSLSLSATAIVRLYLFPSV